MGQCIDFLLALLYSSSSFIRGYRLGRRLLQVLDFRVGSSVRSFLLFFVFIRQFRRLQVHWRECSRVCADCERRGIVDFFEGIKVALFCIGMVFALLAAIYALIRLTSIVIQRYFGGQRTKH